MMGYDNKLLRSFTDMAKANPKRVVFAEANHGNMLKAAAEAKAEGICIPILLGNEERLQKIAAEENISLEGIEIVNLRHDRETERRHRYAKILSEKKAREGVTYAEACEKMVDRNAFGMMMVATGDADAFVTGVYSRYSEVTKMAEPDHRYPSVLHTFRCFEYPDLQERYVLYCRHADQPPSVDRSTDRYRPPDSRCCEILRARTGYGDVVLLQLRFRQAG